MVKDNKIKICIFCGGRGSASIIKNFIAYKNIELTLLINAYDDGKSTGELRRLIPNFLGPSDFRKNFSYLINIYSEQQLNLLKLLELRFKKKITKKDFFNFAKNGSNKNNSFYEVRELLKKLDLDKKNLIIDSLKSVSSFILHQNSIFNFYDCSFGNLIFAGFFLREKNNFNLAVQKYAKLINSDVNIHNVSISEDRKLVAITKDGYFLNSEEKIVDNPKNKKIDQIFLVKEEFLKKIRNKLKVIKKNLIYNQSIPEVSNESKKVIMNSDFIIYGPGTQHSSLYPSYMICNQYIKKSKAKKIMILNLESDKDLINFKSTEIISKALFYLRDPHNSFKVIDKVIVDKSSKFNNFDRKFKNLQIINGDFRSRFSPSVHSGVKIYNKLFELYNFEKKPKLLIYINLLNLSAYNNKLLDDLLESELTRHFDKIQILINSKILKKTKKTFYSKDIEIKFIKTNDIFSEVKIFENWLSNKKNFNYFFSLSGDGIIEINDLVRNFLILKNSNFGAIIGSRTYSYQQHINLIKKIYNSSFLLYIASRLSKKVMTIVFFIFTGKIFSDSNSGFYIFSKENIEKKIKKNNRFYSSTGLIKNLIKNGVEIIESPINFLIHSRFANKEIRIKRFLKNLIGAIK